MKTPDYEIPPCESRGQDVWYATTVLEYIISGYRYSHPDLYASCWAAYRAFCAEHDAFPGELSPCLGVFFNGWKDWFIGRYTLLATELLEKLKDGRMKDELDFWHVFSQGETSARSS